jgi:PAS domain S-box-containing protein
LIGKKHHDLVHHSTSDGKFYPYELCPIHATLKDGTVHSNVNDEVFWRKDGITFRVKYTSAPILEKCKITRTVISFRNISERKMVEKALRESEEKYCSVVESADSLIIWLNQENTITDGNPHQEKLPGYTLNEIIGHSFIEFFQEQDRSRIKELLRMTAREGNEQDLHFRMITRDGVLIEVSMNTAVTRNIENGYSRIICMISAANQKAFDQNPDKYFIETNKK